MIDVSDDLIRSFLVFDVFDPDELGDDSRVSRRFPNYNNFNTYRLRQARFLRPNRSELLSRLAVRREGDLTFSYVGDRFGTEVGIIGEGVPRVCLSFPLKGVVEMAKGPNGSAVAHARQGMVYRGLPGTRFLTSDDNARFNLWIDERRLTRALQAQLEMEMRQPLVFETSVDWQGRGAPVARLVAYLVAELTNAHGLLSTPPALESMTSSLAHLMLSCLPHNYTSQLFATGCAAKPRHLRRAEAFIHAHAHQPMSGTQVAEAAGCSVRTLQTAFREFRSVSPLSAVMEARLRAARTAIASEGDNTPVSDVIRTLGFTNVSRFRNAYRHRFGEEFAPARSRRWSPGTGRSRDTPA